MSHKFKTLSILAVFAVCSASAAYANNDWATVISVEPVSQPIPAGTKQECVEAPVAPSTPGLNTGSVLGGVAGALIGSRFGNGNGKVALAAAGAATGAIVGDRINQSQGNDESPKTAKRCRTVQNFREATDAWRVKYSYNGREYWQTVRFNPGNPGDHLRVISRGPTSVTIIPNDDD